MTSGTVILKGSALTTQPSSNEAWSPVKKKIISNQYFITIVTPVTCKKIKK